MKRLNKTTLTQLPPDITKPSYQRGAITAGIVHFGAGNFHRAHQAVYCDKLLNNGETGWGIIGISLRSSTVRDKLEPQDFLYTQPTLGETSTEYRVIGAIQKILVAPEDPQAVINAVASEQTQLVTSTITEKGYCLNNGEIERNHPDIAHDLKSLDAPCTIYGFIAAALIRRFAASGAPLTILCCDNMNAGGEQLHHGVHMLIKQHSSDLKLLQWLEESVAFSASMVDRVTPATTQELIDQVANKLGFIDEAPVAAEPFIQWVIEDNFAGERPPFEQAGAMFVEDIAPFERVKLRFLNAGHSMLAALGYLAGDTYVHEAIQREELFQFAEQALQQNVLPIIQIPQGVDGLVYIDEVFARFRNANLPYACLQVGTDSSQKIQQRWLPGIDDALAQGQDATYLAFALAIWVVFIRKALVAGDLNDPLHAEFANYLSAELTADVDDFLKLAGAEQFAYFKNTEFMALVKKYHSTITSKGAELAIQDFLAG